MVVVVSGVKKTTDVSCLSPVLLLVWWWCLKYKNYRCFLSEPCVVAGVVVVSEV